LQDSSSPLIEQLNFLHDHTLLILTIITIFVGYIIGILIFNQFTNRYLLHGQTIEII
ncbi:cytochrome c oxidase subunit II transmembrane domain-containing protein, partial [Acinetobacter baumannii]|uniref:cytochrome c oxidase subunit II transmembrane domain-containing protein n=1 Tax=Acinetobacter baumannii TaxID=470 RepID=UPI001C068600